MSELPAPDLIAERTINHPDDPARVLGFACRDPTRGEDAIYVKYPEAVDTGMQASWYHNGIERVYVEIEDTIKEHNLTFMEAIVMEPVHEWHEDEVTVRV